MRKRASLYSASLLVVTPLLTLLPGCGGGNGALVPGATATPQPTTTATQTGTPAGTTTPTTSATASATPIGTPTRTTSATAQPTAPTATPRPGATTQPTTSATLRPTATVRPTATSRPTATARPTATPRPAATATPRPTVTARPTATPLPGLGAPIFFDAFLADNLGQPAQDFNAFFQWNVTGGTVDLLGGNVPGATDQTNGRFVDLDGGQSGRFATRIPLPFAANATYNLRFNYFSTDGKSNAATVTIGSQTFRVTTSARGLQTFDRDFTFPTATTTQLAFQDAGNDGNGIGLDNVVLSQRQAN